MDEMTFDGLRSSPLDRKILRRVVANVAIGLPVTRLAQASFARREPAVTASKAPVVAQKGLRHHARELTRVVTRHAYAALPLVLVFVAGEALLHRRKPRNALCDDAFVASDALAANAVHCEMAGVVERNCPVRSLRRPGEPGR